MAWVQFLSSSKNLDPVWRILEGNSSSIAKWTRGLCSATTSLPKSYRGSPVTVLLSIKWKTLLKLVHHTNVSLCSMLFHKITSRISKTFPQPACMKEFTQDKRSQIWPWPYAYFVVLLRLPWVSSSMHVSREYRDVHWLPFVFNAFISTF